MLLLRGSNSIFIFFISLCTETFPIKLFPSFFAFEEVHDTLYAPPDSELSVAEVFKDGCSYKNYDFLYTLKINE